MTRLTPDGGPDPPYRPVQLLVTDHTDIESLVRTIESTVESEEQKTSLACLLGRTPPEEWQWAWNSTVPWRPVTADIALLTAGSDETPIGDGAGVDTADDGASVDSLAEVAVRERSLDQSNLRGLGEFVLDSIRNWEDAADGAADDHHLVVCFDAVEELLEHHPRPVVFKFLHLVKSRLDAAGAHLIVGLDTDAVPEETRIILSQVFEGGSSSPAAASAD